MIKLNELIKQLEKVRDEFPDSTNKENAEVVVLLEGELFKIIAVEEHPAQEDAVIHIELIGDAIVFEREMKH